MTEENNTEEVETEEKTLEDQLAALEEVAASLEDDADTKADVSSYASNDSEGGEEEAITIARQFMAVYLRYYK